MLKHDLAIHLVGALNVHHSKVVLVANGVIVWTSVNAGVVGYQDLAVVEEEDPGLAGRIKKLSWVIE